jgi:hypothetical protein
MQGVKLVELTLNKFLEKIPLLEPFLEQFPRHIVDDQFQSGKGVFLHKRELPFSGNTTLWTFMLEFVYTKCEAHALLYH